MALFDVDNDGESLEIDEFVFVRLLDADNDEESLEIEEALVVGDDDDDDDDVENVVDVAVEEIGSVEVDVEYEERVVLEYLKFEAGCWLLSLLNSFL